MKIEGNIFSHPGMTNFQNFGPFLGGPNFEGRGRGHPGPEKNVTFNFYPFNISKIPFLQKNRFRHASRTEPNFVT